MSSFSMVLLEGGVDVEVAVNLSEMTSILDAEVPRYSCGDFGYNVRPGRATVGRHWSFEVSVFQLGQPKREFLPLGHMEVDSRGQRLCFHKHSASGGAEDTRHGRRGLGW